jgi:hypothetical protein
LLRREIRQGTIHRLLLLVVTITVHCWKAEAAVELAPPKLVGSDGNVAGLGFRVLLVIRQVASSTDQVEVEGSRVQFSI